MARPSWRNTERNSNEFDGPVSLNGTGTFNVSSGVTMLFANEFSGPGSLVKTGTGTLILSLLQTNGGAEIYTGNTIVGQGTLTLIDTATLTNSPSIIMTNATINLSGVDTTLRLGAARSQLLAGGGVINGALLESAGSTVNPGNDSAPAVLTVSNAVTLNGSVLMDLKRGTGVTNDQIAASSISASGALTVTNLGVDLQSGDKFQLFSVPVSGFSSVNLPLANATASKTYQWQIDLAVNGSITLTNVLVAAGPSTNANITRVTLSGTNLLVHGTNNNVPNTNFHYVVSDGDEPQHGAEQLEAGGDQSVQCGWDVRLHERDRSRHAAAVHRRAGGAVSARQIKTKNRRTEMSGGFFMTTNFRTYVLF